MPRKSKKSTASKPKSPLSTLFASIASAEPNAETSSLDSDGRGLEIGNSYYFVDWEKFTNYNVHDLHILEVEYLGEYVTDDAHIVAVNSTVKITRPDDSIIDELNIPDDFFEKRQILTILRVNKTSFFVDKESLYAYAEKLKTQRKNNIILDIKEYKSRLKEKLELLESLKFDIKYSSFDEYSKYSASIIKNDRQENIIPASSIDKLPLLLDEIKKMMDDLKKI